VGEPLEGHDGAILVVVVSVDGSLIASGGADGTLRYEDLLRVIEAAWSADGSGIVSCGQDGDVCI
jgi:WD40 repeat protein